MDLIAIMAALFLNLSSGCDALKAEVMRVHGEDFMVQSWACEDKANIRHIWRTWQRACMTERNQQYWGRAYFLEDQQSGIAFYVNRFGELQGGNGAQITDAYVPLCGS